MSYKVQLLHVHTDFNGANLNINVLFPLSWRESSDWNNKSLSHLVKYIVKSSFWSHSFNYHTHTFHIDLHCPLKLTETSSH